MPEGGSLIHDHRAHELLQMQKAAGLRFDGWIHSQYQARISALTGALHWACAGIEPERAPAQNQCSTWNSA